jgi:hypothetical protein
LLTEIGCLNFLSKLNSPHSHIVLGIFESSYKTGCKRELYEQHMKPIITQINNIVQNQWQFNLGDDEARKAQIVLLMCFDDPEVRITAFLICQRSILIYLYLVT